MQLSLSLMHQDRSGNNLSDDNQPTQAETSRMKVVWEGKKHIHDVVSTCPCRQSTHTSAKASQYSSWQVWMSAFLLLSGLLGDFIQRAGLDAVAHVFATNLLEDCFPASKYDVDSQAST